MLYTLALEREQDHHAQALLLSNRCIARMSLPEEHSQLPLALADAELACRLDPSFVKVRRY